MGSRAQIRQNCRVVVQLPPGNIVAPNGFPADPKPAGAPQTFLDAMDVRLKVFCEEQKCAVEPELDEDDPKSWSWVLYLSNGQPRVAAEVSQSKEGGSDGTSDECGREGLGEPVATIRIVPPPHQPHPNGYHNPKEEPYLKLTRVATLAHARGKGLQNILLEEAFRYAIDHSDQMGTGWKGLVLTHAQVNVEKWYSSRLGFVTDPKLGVWDEEGIDHVGMWKRLDLQS